MSAKSPTTSASLEPANEDEIRDYAYHLYDQSGYAAGRDLDNWLEAKACLSSGISKADKPHPPSIRNSFKNKP